MLFFPAKYLEFWVYRMEIRVRIQVQIYFLFLYFCLVRKFVYWIVLWKMIIKRRGIHCEDVQEKTQTTTIETKIEHSVVELTIIP